MDLKAAIARTPVSLAGFANGNHAFLPSSSPAMRAVERVVMNEIAGTEIPVLLMGEAGTGKHAVGWRIHQMSLRSSEPFTRMSSADLSPEFLNGKPNGSHGGNGGGTGPGEGTVFLDEVSELNPACQPKLLQLLLLGQEEHAGPRAGWRLLAATRRDLEKEVRAGRFREDLYYRLSGVCLRLPPLRHRKEDIPALANLFLELYANRLGNAQPELSPRALSILLDYSWPGNIRELENAMKKIVALGDEESVMSDLAAHVARTRLENGVDGSISLKQAARAASRQAEKELILRVLARTQWNRKRAARELQISYKALLYKLKQIRQDSADL